MIKTAVDLEIFRPVTVETPQKHAHTQPRHIDCRHIRPHTFVGGRCTSYDFGLQQLLQDLSRKAYWYAIRRNGPYFVSPTCLHFGRPCCQSQKPTPVIGTKIVKAERSGKGENEVFARGEAEAHPIL